MFVTLIFIYASVSMHFVRTNTSFIVLAVFSFVLWFFPISLAMQSYVHIWSEEKLSYIFHIVHVRRFKRTSLIEFAERTFFSKLTDRMCKPKTKTLCEKMFGEISTDFMFRLRFTEHIFSLRKLPVCYFLWENEQFKWLLDIQTMNSAWKFSRSCNNLCLPKVWKKRRLKKRDEFKLEAHSIHFFSFDKKKMKKNTTR